MTGNELNIASTLARKTVAKMVTVAFIIGILSGVGITIYKSNSPRFF